MRYKEVHSIRTAREKIRELANRIDIKRNMIREIQRTEKNERFKKALITIRKRSMGQLRRHIKFYLAEIKLMEKINKLSNEKIY